MRQQAFYTVHVGNQHIVIPCVDPSVVSAQNPRTRALSPTEWVERDRSICEKAEHAWRQFEGVSLSENDFLTIKGSYLSAMEKKHSFPVREQSLKVLHGHLFLIHSPRTSISQEFDALPRGRGHSKKEPLIQMIRSSTTLKKRFLNSLSLRELDDLTRALVFLPKLHPSALEMFLNDISKYLQNPNFRSAIRRERGKEIERILGIERQSTKSACQQSQTQIDPTMLSGKRVVVSTGRFRHKRRKKFVKWVEALGANSSDIRFIPGDDGQRLLSIAPNTDLAVLVIPINHQVQQILQSSGVPCVVIHGVNRVSFTKQLIERSRLGSSQQTC